MRLLRAFALAICASVALGSAPPGAPPAFDYFYLVRQWPATFCNSS